MTIDYTGAVKNLTRVASALAAVGFLISVYIEHKRYKKAGLTTPIIEELSKKIDLHFMKAASAAGIPVGFALIYSAYDTQLFQHLGSLLPYIVISGFILILNCIRTLTR